MGGVLLVCGGVIASIILSAMRVRRQEARCSDLEARQRALLAGRVPATEETSRQLRATWEVLARRAGDWEARLVGSPSSGLRSVSEESVTERADAFFDLAWFAEEMRATAATANVELLPQEAFGFAEHVEGAPRNEDVGRVERQRERIEGLLRELFAAGPARLDYVRRERPVERPPGSLTRGRSSGAERDYFEPTDALLVRHRWDVDTLAFRVSFVTNGAAPLRTFLNRLLEDATGWVVRWVEVNRLEGVASGKGDLALAAPLRVELLVESLEGPVRGERGEGRS